MALYGLLVKEKKLYLLLLVPAKYLHKRRANWHCIRCGWNYLDIFLSHIIPLFFPSLFWISERWKGDNERLCAMESRLQQEIFSPTAGLEHDTLHQTASAYPAGI